MLATAAGAFLFSSVVFVAGIISPRGQRGLEAKIFGLGLVHILMQCRPRSHEGCPLGLVVSYRNYVTVACFIILKLTFE